MANNVRESLRQRMQALSDKLSSGNYIMVNRDSYRQWNNTHEQSTIVSLNCSSSSSSSSSSIPICDKNEVSNALIVYQERPLVVYQKPSFYHQRLWTTTMVQTEDMMMDHSMTQTAEQTMTQTAEQTMYQRLNSRFMAPHMKMEYEKSFTGFGRMCYPVTEVSALARKIRYYHSFTKPCDNGSTNPFNKRQRQLKSEVLDHRLEHSFEDEIMANFLCNDCSLLEVVYAVTHNPTISYKVLFYQACKLDRHDVFDYFLHIGLQPLDVHLTTSNGSVRKTLLNMGLYSQKLLFRACNSGDIDLISQLVFNGLDVKEHCWYGNYLSEAIENCNFDVVELLVSLGMRVDEDHIDLIAEMIENPEYESYKRDLEAISKLLM